MKLNSIKNFLLNKTLNLVKSKQNQQIFSYTRIYNIKKNIQLSVVKLK